MFNGNDALNPKSLSIVEVGYNDTHFAPDNEITKRIQWPILGAMLINAAIKDTDKLRGTAGVRTGFGFLNNPFPGAVTSNTAGDTWQGTFTGPIGYLCIVPATSWGSRVNFEVDGINRGSINSWIPELPVNESGGYAPVVIRFAGLSAGVHTVRVIMGAQTPGSSSANFGICWLAAAIPGPTVLFATIPDYIPSARKTEWTQAYLDLYSILRNDGLNIRLSRWDLINIVAGDLDPDNVHFADPGYLKAANLLNADAFGSFAPVALPGLAQEQRLFRQLEFLVPGVSNFREADRFLALSGLPVVVSAITPLVAGPGEKVVLTVSSTVGLTGVSIQGVQALSFTVLSGTTVEVTLPFGISGQGQFTVAATGSLTIPTGPFITINPRLGAAASNKSRNRKYYGFD
jgi:hypothetical protein